jgi:hypothetical protein
MDDGLNGLDSIIEGRVEELYWELSVNVRYRKLLREHADMFEKLIGLILCRICLIYNIVRKYLNQK